MPSFSYSLKNDSNFEPLVEKAAFLVKRDGTSIDVCSCHPSKPNQSTQPLGQRAIYKIVVDF